MPLQSKGEESVHFASAKLLPTQTHALRLLGAIETTQLSRNFSCRAHGRLGSRDPAGSAPAAKLTVKRTPPPPLLFARRELRIADTRSAHALTNQGGVGSNELSRGELMLCWVRLVCLSVTLMLC